MIMQNSVLMFLIICGCVTCFYHRKLLCKRARSDIVIYSRATDENIAENRKATHEYEIEETIIAGIVLRGSEVKSCRRGGGVQLSDGIVDFREQECWLDNVHISEHDRTGRFDQHAVKRSRKLLLTKKEILKLEQRIIQKNYFIIPMRMFFSDKSFVKVELGIGLAKTVGDKRDDVAKRDGEREIRRVLKNNYD